MKASTRKRQRHTSRGMKNLLGPPTLCLSSNPQLNGSDVILVSGSAFNLSCHGNASVYLSSSSFVRLTDSQQLKVRSSTPRHSGTYRCGYIKRSLQHLYTWIHLYIPDPMDPSSTFVTSNRAVLSLEEGEDYMLKCLLTDPSVTNLTLQSVERGRGLPPGMKVTIDPRRGVLIHDPKTTFSGSYVCTGLKDGRQVSSRPIELLVVSRRWLGPPSVSIGRKETVRLRGEEFKVTCASSNPSHLFNLTWTHALIQTMNISDSRGYVDHHMYRNSTIVVSKVRRVHGGRYTCTGTSEGGVATATTWLHVIDRPFLKVYLQSLSWATRFNGSILTLPQANTTSRSLVAHVSTGTNSTDICNNSIVEVYEGRDVMLTFVIDSYPPITNQFWTTPKHMNDIMEPQESYMASGYSLLLRRVRQGDEGRYSFHFWNVYFNGSQNIDLRIISSPSASVSVEGDYFSCRSSGYPPPLLLLYSCPGLQQTCGNISTSQVLLDTVTSLEGEEVRTRLPLSADDDVTVECVASNLAGESRAIIRPRTPQTVFTMPLIGALTASAFLLLLLLVVFYKYKQKPRYEVRWKIIESFDGNNYTFIDPSQLPYNHNWEFPRDKLRLGAVLGSGAFGKVVEATAFGLETDNKETRVAVKMLKPSAHSEESEALMSELKILSHLGFHDNIVNLLGACTKGGPMLMITEYCCHGDLLNYLRTHAQNFVASMFKVDKVEDTVFYKNINIQHGRLRSDSGISCCSDYQDMQPVPGPGRTHPGMEGNCLSVVDLLWFSYQVAQGLDFLSSRNCIHRDVAARNVLLTDCHVAKICDFGLARDIRNDDSYIVQGNARLPVKWMSPESIFDCVYTVQSDVWSYGVLLWEIFSLGKSPYPNVVVDTNFYKMIKDGRHMEQPDYAPPQMYQLMTLCWSLEPTDRPTFKMIGQLINRLLPSTNKKLPHHCEQPAYRNIDESKEEENQEGGVRKRGEDERGGRHDNSEADDDDEKEPVMRNIYQRS